MLRHSRADDILNAMPTSLVTGGAGFLGSHICDFLLERGHRVVCVDNLETGSLNNIKHIREPGFRFEMLDITDHYDIDEPVDFVYHMASPASPDRLRAAAAAHAQGRGLRHPQHARAREEAPRPLPDRLHQRGVRRSARAPAAGDLLGQREPDRPARRVRRGQALRRGAHDGLPAPAGRGHVHRTDLQHLRPADAPQRRARGADLPAPGARRPARHGLRRRVPDAQLLLRAGPDPRPGGSQRGHGRARPGEHRQPERDEPAGDGRARRRADRVALGGGLRAAPGGRPPGAPAGHHAGQAAARVGARGGAARGSHARPSSSTPRCSRRLPPADARGRYLDS